MDSVPDRFIENGCYTDWLEMVGKSVEFVSKYPLQKFHMACDHVWNSCSMWSLCEM